MAVCKLCGEEYQNLFKHRAQAHRQVQKQIAAQAREALAAKRAARAGSKPQEESTTSKLQWDGKKSAKAKETSPTQLRKASNVAEASFIQIVPKVYTISSTTVQVAKAVCEQEWNWPVLSMEDWLDTYIYETMKQRGIILGAWIKVPRGSGETDAGSEEGP